MKKSILIVDDDKEIRTIIRYSLKKANKDYIIYEAKDGSEGLEKLDKYNDIKVIVLDLIMAPTNGKNVLIELNKKTKNIRIIVLSAFSQELGSNEALKYNVFRFLNKPVSKYPLLFAITSAFNDLRAKELENVVNSIKQIDKPILNRNLNICDVFYQILEQGLNWTDSVNGCILIYDEIEQELKIMGSQSKGKKCNSDVGKIVSMKESISGLVYQNKKAKIIPDVDIEEKYFEIRKGMLSEVAVPLLINSTCVGVLNIESPERNHFVDEDLELLLILAAEASVIIQNVKLKDELVKREGFSKLAQVTAQITHSVGSILGLVNIRAQLMLEKMNNIQIAEKDEFIKDIREIIKKCENATNLKRRILKSYKHLDKLQIVDLSELLKDLITEFQEDTRTFNIKVINNLPPKDHLKIEADSELVRVAFLELIDNSILAMKSGGTLTIYSTFSSDKKSIYVEISDTGIGITNYNIKKLFTPFFSNKKGEEGTGIGLWNAQVIFMRFGGTIRLKCTKINQGTTFVILLPVTQK